MSGHERRIPLASDALAVLHRLSDARTDDAADVSGRDGYVLSGFGNGTKLSDLYLRKKFTSTGAFPRT